MKTRAISLWQPWAGLVAIGEKRIETRSWSTAYRGPLAIHAAKRATCDLGRAAISELQPLTLQRLHKSPGYSLGMIVAVCQLTDVVATVGGARRGYLVNGQVVDPPEFDLGDYSPGRFAWLLGDIRAIKNPIPAKGRQRFWTVDIPDTTEFSQCPPPSSSN